MEKIVNEFIMKLNGKIPDDDLRIVKDQFTIFLHNYDLVPKTTDLVLQLEFKELQRYLISLKVRGRSMETIDAYRFSLDRFLRFTNKPCSEIDDSDIQYFLYELETKRGIKDITRNNELSRIKAFFTWLVNNEYIVKNPCKNIESVKYEKHTRHYIGAVQMEKIRGRCKNLRDKAMVEFMYSTGCRVGELVKVKLSDIDFDKKEVKLFGKGKKERISYLNARAIVAVQNYLSTRKGESEYLFCSYKRPYDAIGERWVEILTKGLGTPIDVKITPHLVRHTTATDAIDHGMPVEQLQILMGHESISTTMEYAEVKQNNVKACHERYIV